MYLLYVNMMLCCVRSLTHWQLLSLTPALTAVGAEYKYQPDIPQQQQNVRTK